MNVFALTIPPAVYDWSGALLVAASLVFLIRKNIWYWHFSNLSLLPYFILFMQSRQFMLAGLQVSYLIFGIHGLYLWILEHRRDRHGKAFDEGFWYNLGWALTLVIFVFTVTQSDFSTRWTWLQFIIVSLSLVANWATTRRWVWSWYVWLSVNVLQAVYFAQQKYWGQFWLQFVLFAMSVQGLIVWRREERKKKFVYVETI